MKKTLLILGVLAILSTTVYSFRGYGYGGGCIGGGYRGMNRGGNYQMGGWNGGYNNLSSEQQQEYLDMRERNIAVYNKYSIEIQQKRLEVDRELLNEKPNWKKIEKLNEEIAMLEAKAKTEMMRNNY